MEELAKLIENSNYLQPSDKEYLKSKLPAMGPVDKLKLKYSLSYGQEPVIIKSLNEMRAKFKATETVSKPNPVSKLIQSVFKPAPPKIVSIRVLDQIQYLGATTQPIQLPNQLPALSDLINIQNLEQLVLVSPRHLDSFMMTDSTPHLLQFRSKLEKMFDPINDFGIRRGYVTLFMSSPLAKAYIQTGLTALAHPELEPNSVILNTLYQIDSQYLNMRQFETTATISSYLRNITGL